MFWPRRCGIFGILWNAPEPLTDDDRAESEETGPEWSTNYHVRPNLASDERLKKFSDSGVWKPR
jgi:hypothetical protein